MPRKRKPWPGETATPEGDAPAPEQSGAVAELASTADVAASAGVRNRNPAGLLAEIAALEAKLRESEDKRSAAEQQALDAAKSQAGLQQREIREVPTGRKVNVQRLDRYETVGYKDDGRPILKPRFKTVELPTYFYLIDMAPCGGEDLKINGNSFYHGETYELDEDTLRTVKDIVYRTHRHDQEIHGNHDENAYRKPTNRVLRGGARA